MGDMAFAEMFEKIRKGVLWQPTDYGRDSTLAALSRLESEHARVVADNAALTERLNEFCASVEDIDWEDVPEARDMLVGQQCAADALLAQPHPGSELLEENKRLQSERDAWRERCHVMEGERDDARARINSLRVEIGAALGMSPVERATGGHVAVAERLRADAERLRDVQREVEEHWLGDCACEDSNECLAALQLMLEPTP